MDGAAQAAAYAAADFAAGDQAFVDRFAAHYGAIAGPLLLDLGCGPGNITMRLAERFPSARVLGVDGAAAMLQIARDRLEAQPQRWPGVTLVHALLTPQGLCPAPPPLNGAATGPAAEVAIPGGFTAVVSNSLLHHLHDPQALWHTLRALAAPGAAVYVKDLRRPPSAAAALALRDRYLAGAPAVLQHDYVASLHAAFTAEEVQQQLAQAGLADQLQLAELEDRYLEVWGRLR